jgi:EmrB/QacA subfamily drug resistance transporter
MSITTSAQPVGAQVRAPGLALAVLCAATLMIVLDGTIVTVALPSIQRDLGFTAAGLSWVLNVYLIAFAGLLLLAGRLGDLIGRKTMFLAGLSLFTGASLACGLATGPLMLITARFVQGVGAAMVSSVTLGMIVGLYADQQAKARAIGAVSFVGASGASIGLVLGGILTEAISWHWIFFVNLPMGIAAGLAGLRLLPADTGAGLRGGADALGATLVTTGLMTAIYALVGTAHYGWASTHTLVLAAIAIVALAAFIIRQATARRPLLALRILASRDVAGANLAQALVIAAAFGFQVQFALYLQRVLGFQPAAVGLGLLPAAVIIGIVSLGLSARLTLRFGARALLLTGLAFLLVAFVFLVRAPVPAGHPAAAYLTQVLPLLLLFGVGGGLTLPALATLGMSDASPADAGVVSGLFNTTQQGGAAIGVALLSTLAAARTAGLRHADGRLAAMAALADGYRLAFAGAAALTLAALVVAALVLRSRAASGTAAARAAAGPGNRVPTAPDRSPSRRDDCAAPTRCAR